MLVPIADGHRSGPTPKSTSAPAPAPATDPASSTLSRLPAELQIAISEYLPYPDALSFKHTSRHFYLLVRTDVKLRVQWLIARMDNHLEGPNMKRCDLRTDRSFWRGNVPYVLNIRDDVERLTCAARWYSDIGLIWSVSQDQG